jgi:hypothetical protein
MTSIRRTMETLGEAIVPILLAFVIALLSAVGSFFGYFTFCESAYAGWDFKSTVALAPLIAIAVGILVFVGVLRWTMRRGNAGSSEST